MNRICELFGIRYPIVQGGMVWCSGWRLASAVSNAGGLGLLGAGSMHPDMLREHIAKCREATSNPFGVNVPLMYPEIDKLMQILIEEKVKIVFTSAGNPALYTDFLHRHGITVAHVVSSSRFARKCEQVGVDAVVAEGVQVGSRFALSKESSAHENFKRHCLNLQEGDTFLTLKKLSPIRLVKNEFYESVENAQQRGASIDELRELLGKGRAKKGIFEGDLQNGELEIGQVSAMVSSEQSAAEIIDDMISVYRDALKMDFERFSF